MGEQPSETTMKQIIRNTLAILSITIGASIATAASLEISGDDTMRFNVTALETAAGQETTLVFKNNGSLPKAAMGHNFVLLKPGTDLASFGNAAIAAAANEYIPKTPELKEQVVAHTKVLGPGETATISFTIDTPGEYPFICSFPGHWAIMQGTLTVR